MSASEYDLDRIKETKELLKLFNLNLEHVDVIQDKVINPTADAPYHNAQHLMTVAINCVRLAQYYSSATDRPEIKHLFLAGLYHDINHSLGRFGDSVNVSIAVNDMVTVMKNLEPDTPDEEITKIADLILATGFPHKQPLNLQQKIIQDSDMLQWIEPDQNRWFAGLTAESGKPVTWESTKKFLNNATINTYQARTLLHQHGFLKQSW